MLETHGAGVTPLPKVLQLLHPLHVTLVTVVALKLN
jgi:hypothetical protein